MAARRRSDDDSAPLDIPPEFRRIVYTPISKSVRWLWNAYVDGQLILEPDFQRNYVWDTARASRFIESLLLDMPTPHIFLGEEDDGSLMVIDGHQRLETIFRYLQPLHRRRREPSTRQGVAVPAIAPLTLRKLNVLDDLSGKRVTALSIDDREQLWNATLPVIILLKENHHDLKFELFSRLNQGAMNLTDQELRNCIYRGRFNRMLADLSESRDFLNLLGRTQPDRRMRTREQILRFFALLHRRDRYRPPLREFLNEEMRENRDAAQASFLREFDAAVTWVERVFDKEAFRLYSVGNENNPAGRWARNRSDLIRDLEMVGFAELSHALAECWQSLAGDQRPMFVLAVRCGLIGVMTRDRFRDAMSRTTASQHSVNVRFDMWLGALRQIVANPESAIQDVRDVIEQLEGDIFCGVCRGVLRVEDAHWTMVGDNDEPVLVHGFCNDD